MNREALEHLFNLIFGQGTAISHHMPKIRQIASECRDAVEFGVKRGGSTVSLLLGCGRVTSYDIKDTPQSARIKQWAGGAWDYRIMDSRTAVAFQTDLIMFDSLHTYDQVKAELDNWGAFARRYMIFHDTTTFGYIGADGETGKHDPDAQGIIPAIAEFMESHPEWKVNYTTNESHGLLILKRDDD